MSDIISVGKDDFTTEVLESQLPVLIDFWAVWCGPCRMFAPVVNAIAKNYADKLKVVKVNTDNEPELAEKFEIEGIPTLVLMREGEFVDALINALPLHTVEEWLQGHGVI